MPFCIFLIVLCLCTLGISPNSVQAEMYSYVDSQGVYHYTNAPGDGRYKLSNGPIRKRNSAQESRLLRTISRRSRTQGTRQMYDLFYFRPGAGSAYSGTASPAAISQYIDSAAELHQIDPLLVKAVIKAESNFNPRAMSSKGAQGLMQLMPGTARDMNVRNPFDAKQNIFGGTRYLRAMLNNFNGDIELSLAAYNAGPNRVAPIGAIPNIPETKAYVTKVLHHYKAYRRGKIASTAQQTSKGQNRAFTRNIAAQATPDQPSKGSSINVQQLVTTQ